MLRKVKVLLGRKPLLKSIICLFISLSILISFLVSIMAPIVHTEKYVYVSSQESFDFCLYQSVSHATSLSISENQGSVSKNYHFIFNSAGTTLSVKGSYIQGAASGNSLVEIAIEDRISLLDLWSGKTLDYNVFYDELKPEFTQYPYVCQNAEHGYIFASTAEVSDITDMQDIESAAPLFDVSFWLHLLFIWLVELILVIKLLHPLKRQPFRQPLIDVIIQARTLYAPDKLSEGKSKFTRLCNLINYKALYRIFLIYLLVAAAIIFNIKLVLVFLLLLYINIRSNRKKIILKVEQVVYGNEFDFETVFCYFQSVADEAFSQRTKAISKLVGHKKTFYQLSQALLWSGHLEESVQLLDETELQYPDFMRDYDYYRQRFWQAFFARNQEKEQFAAQRISKLNDITEMPRGKRKKAEWKWKCRELELMTNIAYERWDDVLEDTDDWDNLPSREFALPRIYRYTAAQELKKREFAWLCIYRYTAAQELKKAAVIEETLKIIKANVPELFPYLL